MTKPATDEQIEESRIIFADARVNLVSQLITRIDELKAELAALSAKLRKAGGVLKYYADTENWEDIDFAPTFGCSVISYDDRETTKHEKYDWNGEDCGGKRARAYFAESK